ncbi:anchored repeat ABC transporter, substrate-binding protein [Arthrobacter russicus]|jgi:anchored repeat ABC transporter substrate-binding protein|uniref:Anchored repeat ABC transporter substrate-binding protein n=1 Tax=Arthrobacter russicus TaxID=172040 RepID=A0ABU1JCD4_9MICC|nr:anchored repeat ABC transporter, substrate-binding protein [Arthrobacter russicus]MDR6269815.1 anchored repeat ABC transporter substrate-binding protein [Arthrobacter russicus]
MPRSFPASPAPGRAIGAALAVLLLLSGCSATSTFDAGDHRLKVVASTGIIADLAKNVAGNRAEVLPLVPEGADPHSYEPTLRDVRNIAYADVAFTNHLLLEEHNLIKSLDANLRPGTPNISLAEASEKYGAHIMPLLENLTLDTIWLGLRVRGAGTGLGADRNSDVLLSAVSVDGPGALLAYGTETFGKTELYFDSTDGVSPEKDRTTLPPDAHTHLSWAFTAPGIYRLTVQADLKTAAGTQRIGEQTFSFAVGVNPAEAGPGKKVLGSGHADVTADLDRKELYLYADPEGSGDYTQSEFDAGNTVIEVPNKALHEVPAGPGYRFLGSSGAQVYQLPQAVLGKHVHGEIDPHLWQDVRNAKAYLGVIKDALIAADPAGREDYTRNAQDYSVQLDELDRYVEAKIDSIPEANRQLITTHDAFGYFADRYRLKVAGFVTPNPATEPSVQERQKLTQTIQNLQVPAVFLEPNLRTRSATLTQLAAELGINVCSIYGDSFDQQVSTYLQMMRANADSLANCLNPRH